MKDMAVSGQVNIHRYDPPLWFKEADFGIFIHWGLYSVPAYAPPESEDFDTIANNRSSEYLFKHTPYAEWYQNSIAIAGSPAQEYHRTHYGDMPYTAFADTFRQTAKKADPEKWADLFQKAGAKYVVLVSKHHDGFVMFDSHQPNPNIEQYMLDFDFAGQLATACRKKGLRFGVYYSSLLDWTFTKRPVRSNADLLLGNDNSARYMDYCRNHWLEIIERYHPDILWSDIGYPADPRLEDLFDAYYKAVPDGMVNDRWGQWPNVLRNPVGRGLFNVAARLVQKHGGGNPADAKYFDYRTLEYTTKWSRDDVWFEVCRGMDKSFGYNRFSNPQDHITADEVRQMVAELQPKKGRLLLNVGPDENGMIPEYQKAVLDELRNQ